MERRYGAEDGFGFESRVKWSKTIPGFEALLFIKRCHPCVGENNWFRQASRAGCMQYHQRIILCRFKTFIELILSDLTISEQFKGFLNLMMRKSTPVEQAGLEIVSFGSEDCLATGCFE